MNKYAMYSSPWFVLNRLTDEPLGASAGTTNAGISGIPVLSEQSCTPQCNWICGLHSGPGRRGRRRRMSMCWTKLRI